MHSSTRRRSRSPVLHPRPETLLTKPISVGTSIYLLRTPVPPNRGERLKRRSPYRAWSQLATHVNSPTVKPLTLDETPSAISCADKAAPASRPCWTILPSLRFTRHLPAQRSCGWVERV